MKNNYENIIKICFLLGLIILVACVNPGLKNKKATENIRFPSGILYLSGSNRPTEIYSYSLESNLITQITFTDGKIYDFTISDNSQKIVYGILNQYEGIDYWSIEGLNSSPNFLFSCDEDLCFDPEFSQNGEILLVNRSKGNLFDYNENGVTTWVFNFSNNQFEPFYNTIPLSGRWIKYSKNQDYIAYQQTNPNGLRIVNLSGEEHFFFDKQRVEGMFEWSMNKNVLYFITEEIIEELPITKLWSIDVDTDEFKQITLNLISNLNITQIKTSSDQSKILFGVKENPLLPNQSLIIYELNTRNISSQLNNPSISYGNISWTSDNTKVLFQQFEFNGTNGTPEIGYWDLDTNSVNMLIKDAYSPVFVP